jgi:hypothetical protein
VLKVDVEGHELAVFEGARRLLTAAPSPLIIFEFCDWAESRFENTGPGQAQAFLMSHGYDLWRLEDYGKGQGPLRDPIKQGSSMIVGARR